MEDQNGTEQRIDAGAHSSGPGGPADIADRAVIDKDELLKLQSVFGDALEENERLRDEIAALRKDLDKTAASRQKARADLAAAKRQIADQSGKILTLSHQLKRMQGRYDALSRSKLGRLTLYWWSLCSAKRKKGHQSLSSRLFSRYTFSRTRLGRWLLRRHDRTLRKEADAVPGTAQADPIEGTAGMALPAPPDQPLVVSVPDQSLTVSASDQQAAPGPTASDQAPGTVVEDGGPRWIERYEDRIAEIPESDGCRFYERSDLRIGIICDEFFYDSIRSAADFRYVTPDTWRSVLDEGLDVFLFVSSWRGIHDEWAGLAALSAGTDNAMQATAMELLEACKEKGIPTVFYSKEDPPNYVFFVEFAKRCDHILTSARECVPYYVRDCGNDSVEDILFCIDPQEHNPIGSHRSGKEKVVLFSGSWMRKYPERCRDLSAIFDGVLSSSYDLHIIDRNFPKNRNYAFPPKYAPYISEAVSHQELQKLHKLFDVAINANSVKGSETMFANRAYELQANGVLLISNYSLGMNGILPNVLIAHDKDEVAHIMTSMDDEEIYERQMAGVRAVMTGHTCYDRITQFLRPCGIHVGPPERTVLVVAAQITDKIHACFDRQTYPHKRLAAEADVTEELFRSCSMVGWFSEDAEYGVFYLEDLVNGFKYTSSDYITKDAWYQDGELQDGVEHEYVHRMRSKYRTLFWREAYTWEDLRALDGERRMANGYSIDHFSYAEGAVERPERKNAYALSVIVPVYQNGEALYGKCFSSLRRSSLFDDMEILLVDDGSMDERTLLIEEDLRERFPNVVLYRFGDGGSGSASRPRNKGVEMASAPYIAFLDPDNEAVCDGYAQMYQLAEAEDLDLVLGEIYQCRVSAKTSNYHQQFMDLAGTDEFDDGIGELLKKSAFIAPSIQAMVIRKQLLMDHELTQVVGAIGQDTLFSWQILQYAKRIRLVDHPIHVYYAKNAGSVTNAAGPGFFEKLLRLQVPKREWLEREGLLRTFMEARYDYYTDLWVFHKLSSAQDAETCARLVEKYLDVYQDAYRHTDPIIDRFSALCAQGDYAGAVAYIQKEFPPTEDRPFLTRAEIRVARLQDKRKQSPIQATYRQDRYKVYLRNTTKKTGGETYCWTLLLAHNNGYEKVSTSGYSDGDEFVLDLSDIAPDTYKVRAFIRWADDKKVSQDVLFVSKKPDGTVEVIKKITLAEQVEVD